MGININDLDPKVRKRIIERPYDHPPRRPLPDTKPERNQKAALGAAVPGEAKGMGRPRIRFTLYRTRLLDDDNAAGSIKDCVDGLREASLIQGDAPWQIELQKPEQVKVAHRKDERTEILIEYPD